MVAVGVGQNKEPGPLLARTDFSRRMESRRNVVAHGAQVSDHGVEAETEVSGDVFKKDAAGADLSDNARDLRPKVSWIFGAAAPAAPAEGLARVPGGQNIDVPSPWAPVEGREVIPDGTS